MNQSPNTVQVHNFVVLKIDQFVKDERPVTTEQIREWVDRMADMVMDIDAEDVVDRDQLVKDIEADFNVHVGDWNFLSDDSDHVPWLHEKREEKEEWPFWRRYERFLRDEVGLPKAAVDRLDEVTDDILGRLEDPTREGAWDRRGLVAGQVQSGKTGNYTGLMAKGMDNGYKLIVVLAGVHNSLRSQTQARIDEGILGFDTRSIRRAVQADGASRVGVGRLAGRFLHVNSFTSSLDNGDFKLSVAQSMGVAPGGSDPIVLVVKKNKSILKNLYQWATNLKKERDPETGRYRVRNVPVLVIDDEADHASVNTRFSNDDEEIDPSAINGLIRQFLDTFEKTSYVAYTATPFANIFIDPETDHSSAGEDLFPRSFIVNLPVPSTYVGPERVFGLLEDVSFGIEAVKPLNIVRSIFDYGDWLPDKHKAAHALSAEVPESLREAILFFLMAGAVRALRGQGERHHSMLVHGTRFVDVQRQVASQISALLEDITNRLRFGEGASASLRAELEELYVGDLCPITAQLTAEPDLVGMTGPVPPFAEVFDAMKELSARTRVHLVNGQSADALEYVDHPQGLSVIAIGGDKLSRGLTLEGLCVSYYLRASRMYDTLMQMGRWFGYRPGYLDLCRLYTSAPLIDWYKSITAASAELQSEFDSMAATGGTPEDFGLRVRQLPDGLLVTSPAKLRNAQRYSVTFSGTISETVTFAAAARKKNLAALEELVGSMGAEDTSRRGMRLWRDVSPAAVLAFLDSYEADARAFKARPGPLAEYIRSRNADGELGQWTVVLADSTQKGAATWKVAGRDVRLTQRALHGEESADRYAIRRAVSPSHELVDLEKGTDSWYVALEQTVAAWERSPSRKPDAPAPSEPSPRAERNLRDPDRGLLIIYPLDPTMWDRQAADSDPFVAFAVSFPRSDAATPIEYQVNPVFLRNLYGLDDIDDE